MNDLTSKRFLIVDDQKPFLLLLKGIIKGMGVQDISTAQSAEAAISMCKKLKFDVVIADLHLGTTRKNGYQFLEEIRVRKYLKPEAAFLMVSGDSQRPIVLGSIERSPDDYIIKPFSQAQLINRINKAHSKRHVLKPIYQEIYRENYKAAISACQDLIKENNKYRQTCILLMCELFWRTEQYEDAYERLKLIVDNKPLPWAMAALARTMFYMERYDDTVDMAKQLIAGRIMMLEGWDILAHCYMAVHEYEEAIIAVKKALELSPFSMERQYLGAAIGRESEDFEFAKQCCKELFEQSKMSVHRDLSHMCNYVRSILDAAEHAEDKSNKNRFQQEAMLTLQRLRSDDLVTRNNEQFDYDIYENIVTARVNALDGKNIDAKKVLTRSQQAITEKFEQYPMVFAPDSIKVMSDLGEFEEAKELAKQMKTSDTVVDANIQHVLDSLENTADEKLKLFNMAFQEGRKCFNEGKFAAAYESYEKALTYSPVNVDVTINLLLCLSRLIEQAGAPDATMSSDCKRLLNMITGLPLTRSQGEELAKITEELSNFVEFK